jgi:hypothetical protein
MKPETKAWWISMQRKYGKYLMEAATLIPEKYNVNIYIEAAQAGAEIGEAAAKHQLETGFLGQFGAFGGAPFTPSGIEQEMHNLRFSRIF